MDRNKNDLVGKLFLFFGGVVFYALLLIDSISYCKKIVSILGMIVYLAILTIYLLSIWYPNSKSARILRDGSLDNLELLVIIVFGVITFFSFLEKTHI